MSELLTLKKLGKKIRDTRIRMKMTQENLAQACNLEKSRLSKIENGLANPTIRSLHKICNALGLSLAELFL